MARRNKAVERAIAERRLQRLLQLAEAAARAEDLDDAARYLELARAIQTRYVLRAPARLKARTCPGCGGFLLPGHTARTRLTGSKVSTTCLACGHVRRHPYVAEQKARRRP